MMMLPLGVLLMAMIGSANVVLSKSGAPYRKSPARLAIYYGYPSLVNGANGDIDKAAHFLAFYDVIVLGDGLEFPDKRTGRYPEGDPGEHRKVLQIVEAIRSLRPSSRIYGYVCLGEISALPAADSALSLTDIEERIQLWKQMGVSGIFFDEAGYDYRVVTRARQNFAVKTTHDHGMSAFMNAYFPSDLFAQDNSPAFANGKDKNSQRLPCLLDARDAFLLESFQIKNGAYEDNGAWQSRLKVALEYRRQFGPRVFVTTTTTASDQFSVEKLNYVWWTAIVHGLDGLSWGEPNFSASNNSLPDRRCVMGNSSSVSFPPTSTVHSGGGYFWRQSGAFYYVVDTRSYSVYRLAASSMVPAVQISNTVGLPATATPLTCEDKRR